MLFEYSQFAVDGGGIGNDPALYLYSVGHLTTAFLYPTNTSYAYNQTGYNRARCLRRI